MLRNMARTIALGGALALAACTTAQTADSGAARRDCFRALDVRTYGVVDDSRVRVHVSPQREYILTITRPSAEIDWTHAISIRSVTSFICVGEHANVQLMGGEPPLPYQVTRIERAPHDTVEGS